MNIELVSYREFPSDQYTKAVCTVCLDGKYNVSYGKKITKDGKSFWAAATHGVSGDGGAKEYIAGFELDSNKENEKILAFVRSAASQAQKVPVEASLQQEVANQQDLPF